MSNVRSSFKRFVEVGRTVLITQGPHQGRLAVIVEIVDGKRVLIDGPETDVPRQVISLAHLSLLPIVLPKFPRGARSGTVKKFWTKANVENVWKETRQAKKIEIRQKRAGLSDFERFVVLRLKKQRRDEVKKSLAGKRKATA